MTRAFYNATFFISLQTDIPTPVPIRTPGAQEMGGLNPYYVMLSAMFLKERNGAFMCLA